MQQYMHSEGAHKELKCQISQASQRTYQTAAAGVFHRYPLALDESNILPCFATIYGARSVLENKLENFCRVFNFVKPTFF